MEIPEHPGLYFICLGKLKDCKNFFSKEYDEELYIGKFGISKNINKRFEQNKNTFGKLGCNSLSFKYCVNLKDKLYECENELCEKLHKNGIIKLNKDNQGKGYRELFLYKEEDFEKIKNIYDYIYENQDKIKPFSVDIKLSSFGKKINEKNLIYPDYTKIISDLLKESDELLETKLKDLPNEKAFSVKTEIFIYDMKGFGNYNLDFNTRINSYFENRNLLINELIP